MIPISRFPAGPARKRNDPKDLDILGPMVQTVSNFKLFIYVSDFNLNQWHHMTNMLLSPDLSTYPQARMTPA